MILEVIVRSSNAFRCKQWPSVLCLTLLPLPPPSLSLSLSPSPSPLSIPKGPMPNLKSKVALGWPDLTYLFEGRNEEDQEYTTHCATPGTHTWLAQLVDLITRYIRRCSVCLSGWPYQGVLISGCPCPGWPYQGVLVRWPYQGVLIRVSLSG